VPCALRAMRSNYCTVSMMCPFARDNGWRVSGSLLRVTHCMVEGAGRSGFEAENCGVIELQETIVQVT